MNILTESLGLHQWTDFATDVHMILSCSETSARTSLSFSRLCHRHVRNYITYGQGITRCYSSCQCCVAISRVGFQEGIKILTSCSKYQGIYGYLVHPEMFSILLSWQSLANNQVIPSGGYVYLLVYVMMCSHTAWAKQNELLVVGPSPKRQQLGVIRQARSFRQTPIVSSFVCTRN